MGKDDATWLNICYVLFALISAYVGYQAILTLGVQLGWAERYDEWFPLANNVGCVLVGGVAAFWVRSSAERREYHEASIGEVRKVTWPSVDDTKKMTWIVAIVVAVFAVILAVYDVVWSKILQWIIS